MATATTTNGTTNGVHKTDNVFDYIICGGGTSGSVVAGRLAEDVNATVLVIEAGQHNRDLENTHIAGAWTQNLNKETDWQIETEPTAGVKGRKIAASRGRFLGGSSGINGTLCIRGPKQDYDDWNLEGWSGDEVHAAMMKAETFHNKDWFAADKKSHGTSGPLHNEPHDLAPISEKIMESYQDLGMPFDPDMFTTGNNPHGCGHTVRTIYQGIRTTGADFITKGYHRDNITISCNRTVNRVILEEKDGGLVATGVEMVDDNGTPSVAHARREVIVSGGTYCSPAILLRSGIGPRDELTKHNIDCKVDLPGVGKNLMDHLIVCVFYEVSEPDLTHDSQIWHGDGFMNSYTLWKKEKKGFLSSFPFGAFAYARLDDRLKDEPVWRDAPRQPGRDPMGLTPKQPNVEFFSTECYGGPPQYVDAPGEGEYAFSLLTELFAPHARGTVTLSSKEPLAKPVVNHNYLDNDLDLVVLSEGVRLGNEVIMKGRGTKDVIKGSWPKHLTHHTHDARHEWEDYVRSHATTCYHPGGTCKMGEVQRDATAVVDPRLRVNGVRGLRVADVSIMPRLNQGHTQMPAYAIGERCADFIKMDHVKH